MVGWGGRKPERLQGARKGHGRWPWGRRSTAPPVPGLPVLPTPNQQRGPKIPGLAGIRTEVAGVLGRRQGQKGLCGQQGPGPGQSSRLTHRDPALQDLSFSVKRVHFNQIKFRGLYLPNKAPGWASFVPPAGSEPTVRVIKGIPPVEGHEGLR